VGYGKNEADLVLALASYIVYALAALAILWTVARGSPGTHVGLAGAGLVAPVAVAATG